MWLIYLAGPARSAGCQVHRLSSFHVQTSRRAKVGGMMGSSRQRNPRTHPPTRRLRAITTGIARASIIKLAVRGPGPAKRHRLWRDRHLARLQGAGNLKIGLAFRTLQTSRRAKGRGKLRAEIAPQLDSLDWPCTFSCCKMSFTCSIRVCTGRVSLSYRSSRLASAGPAGLGQAGPSPGADRAACERCRAHDAEDH